MKSSIIQLQSKNQMCLAYDCLTPEEGHKLLDAITDDSMVEIMCDNFYEPSLSYAVTGYRMENGEKKYSRELCLFIDSMVADEDTEVPIRDQMVKEKEELEKVQKLIKEKTGID